MYSLEYVAYTALLTIFPVGTLILIILQVLADKYGQQQIKDKTAKILLYGVYISAFICTCFGFSLHTIAYPLWCTVYGMPPCFAVLGGTKGFLYVFFLRRAKSAHAGNVCMSKRVRKLLFDKIGPLYIFIYWAIYVISATSAFTGKPVETSTNLVTRCLFASWKLWFVVFADCVDLFNSITTLLLFLVPLIKSVRKLKTDDTVNNRLLAKFIAAMKWNVVLSFIATMSSVLTLIALPNVKAYAWVFCLGDPFVNSVCVFLMMATNRKFIKKGLGIFQITHSVESASELQSKAKAASYDMDGIDIAPDLGNVEKNASDEGVLSMSEFSKSSENLKIDVGNVETKRIEGVVSIFSKSNNNLQKGRLVPLSLPHQSHSY